MDITELDLSEFLESEERVELDKKLAAEANAFLDSCGKENLEIFRME